MYFANKNKNNPNIIINLYELNYSDKFRMKSKKFVLKNII